MPTRPRVLLVHNAYQQRGGEDSVLESEMALLRQQGHEVALYHRSNDDIQAMSKPELLANTLWSRQTVRDIHDWAARFKPDVIHVHNTLPLVSPSVYWGAADVGVPVVQTLHNYRLACLDATFLREGRICEDCLGKVPWRGVVHGCYRGSALHSGAMASMLVMHRAIGTYRRKVTRYIALSEFGRAKLTQAGLPAERISVKPNFLEWRDQPDWSNRDGGLFVGRLSPEKGVDVLLQALARLPSPNVRVVGGGPLEGQVHHQLGPNALGFQPLPQVMALMQSAAFMVLPSLWYEGFPRTIVEAFANGTPVVASRLGAMAEVIEDGVTGLLFTPGDVPDLTAKLAWALSHPQDMLAMGRAARRRYETHYSPDVNHAQLLSIYSQAITEHHADGGSS
ncbi:glycosyltransferase family 1 protein [Aquabacterium soli]|uniref:Glycosyltransferase family 1 protein n=1 Tax=Aquabacterium soli TaxID=2493092 RepID=A0A3R8RZD4_9BURK|nr:glycosyltransferase family 4 protein [Aquabacterium soli]RRR99907.1 glycosyltransferase family 1 protein [Aquabacterium soli]